MTENFAVTRTYSLSNKHIALVNELADRLSKIESRKVSQGEVVRKAIDLLYERVEAEKNEKVTA